jgi:sugar lactone lactonase YvrE
MVTPMHTTPWSRRTVLLALPAALAACAAPPAGDAPPRAPALLSVWRTLPGGYLAPPSPVVGLPPRAGTGMFVKLLAPTAVALRGDDLLVVDSGQGRLWRADALMGTMTGIAGAPTGASVSIALGADLSAWVLDPLARQVLRFGRDGRLLQSFGMGAASPAPSAFVLLDGGATLLVSDGASSSWTERRNPAGPALEVLPQRADGTRLGGVDAIAAGRERLWVLDQRGGAVHAVQRDGRVVESRGAGVLRQPRALAVDAHDRVWVLEGFEPALVMLARDREPLRIDARTLRLQQPSALAIDALMLALADRLTGTVTLFRLGPPGATQVLP